MVRNNKPQPVEPEAQAPEETREVTPESPATTSPDAAGQEAPRSDPAGAPPPEPSPADVDAAAPPIEGAKQEGGAQYEFEVVITDHTGRSGDRRVHVTARTEAEAFDFMAQALGAIVIDEEPITWRYTGRFRKLSA